MIPSKISTLIPTFVLYLPLLVLVMGESLFPSSAIASVMTRGVVEERAIALEETTEDATEDAIIEATPTAPVAPAPVTPVPVTLESPQVEPTRDGMGQIISVSQLSDVHPSDWAFQSLQSLVEKYGCITGLPDGRYLGNRTLRRFEFATGVQTCLEHLQETMGLATRDLATPADLELLQKLQAEFAAEIGVLRGQVETLESRVSTVETEPFATTTQLRGRTIFAISDIMGGDDTNRDNNLVLQSRIELSLDASFNGEDRLRTVLTTGNFDRFTLPDNSPEGRLSFATNTEELALDSLSYEFPVEDATFTIFALGGNLNDFVTSINPLSSSNQGAISRFAQRNPIYRAAGLEVGSGIGASFEVADELTLNVGYLASNSSDSTPGNGLFNGGYALIGQVAFTPQPLEVAIAYAHSYVPNGGNSTGTGSTRAIVEVPYAEDDENSRPVIVNAYALELNYKISEHVEVGGWLGFSSIRVLGLGDAEVWNYAARLAFPDLGGEGNLAGVVVGMQPRLTGTTPGLGLELGERHDPDVGMHIEGFYRIRLHDNISITPGIIWLTAPNHDQQNGDAIITTIRTTFNF